MPAAAIVFTQESSDERGDLSSCAFGKYTRRIERPVQTRRAGDWIGEQVVVFAGMEHARKVHQVIQVHQVEVVMSTVLDRCGGAVADTDYRMVGTAAALLHGVPLPAADIDVLLRERAGVDAFSAALHPYECLSPPQYLGCSRQYFASFRVQDVKVEFSTVEADSESVTSECMGTGPWRHFVMVRCGRRHIPVVALELRLLTEMARGRADRYVPLWRFMQSREFDAPLLMRGLKDRGIRRVEHIDLTSLAGLDVGTIT